MSPDSRFFAELKRRNVFRAGAAYLVLAWLIVQVADILLDTFAAPSWVMQLLVAALAAGFPVALILSWIYEITTSGVKRTEDVKAGESITAVTGRKLDFLVIGVLSVIVLVFAIERFVLPVHSEADSMIPKRQSVYLAVLPFEIKSTVVSTHFRQLQNELIRLLRRSKDILVASDDAVEALSPNASPREKVEQLGVRFLLTGQLMVSESGPVLHMTLTDVVSEKINWESEYSSIHQPQVPGLIARDISEVLGLEPLAYPSVDVSETAFNHYLRARQLLSSDRASSAALELLDQAISESERFPSAHAAMCGVYIDRYREDSVLSAFTNAERHCLRAWTLDNGSVDTLYALALLYSASGQIEKARDYATAALAINPGYLEAQVLLASSYFVDNPELAEVQLQSIIAENPGSPAAYASLQSLYFRQGRATEAVEQLAMALELTPNDEYLKFRQSSNYLTAGMFDEAEDLLRDMIANGETGQGDVYSNLATAMFFGGDFAGAAELYTDAISREPEHPMFHRNLGDAVWHLNGRLASQIHFEKAVELSRAQLEINSDDHWVMQDLVVAYASLGNLNEYMSVRTQLVDGWGTNPYVHYSLSVGASRLGQMEIAKTHAKESLRLGFPPAILSADPDILASGATF